MMLIAFLGPYLLWLMTVGSFSAGFLITRFNIVMRADLAMDYTTCELPLACILNQIRLDAISTANCRRCSSSITLSSPSVLSIQVKLKIGTKVIQKGQPLEAH